MKKFLGVFVVLINCVLSLKGQNLVDVTDQTFKLPARGEQAFYYAFAEGDKITINFQELDNKELRSFEVTELPSSSRLTEYQVGKISNKQISINKNSIYKFRFSNPSLTGRVCKFTIQRLPAGPSTASYNTSVYKEQTNDSLFFYTTERYLESTDTTAVSLVNMIAKVAGRASLDKNSHQTIVDFTLPPGTISWAYYLGVGTEGLKAEAEARSKFINTSASLLSKFEGYGSMAALALYGINAFDKAQGDDNVKYWFLPGWDNVQKYKAGNKFAHYKQGDVVNDAVQMKNPLSGKVFLALENDNMMQSIDVLVKVTAIQVKQKWGNRMVKTLAVPTASGLL